MVFTTLTPNRIETFKATSTWHRYYADSKIFYSDGIRYLADSATCYWLLDDIVSAQTYSVVSKVKFQIWTIEKIGKRSAVLWCEDEHGTKLFRKTIAYTVFPLKRVVIYMVNKNIMLASEY